MSNSIICAICLDGICRKTNGALKCGHVLHCSCFAEMHSK